ncbi:hypothetical protein ACHQM5_027292 [Ranunculus cassubicifolius]
MNQTIEHIVLFKTRDNTEQSKIDELIQGLDDLRNLDNVLHLTTGTVHKTPSSSLSSFNVFLHSRYPTKLDLDNYMGSDQHLTLVKNVIRPINEDYMIVDWVYDHEDESLDHPSSGSALRVTFLKLKQGLLHLGEDEKTSVVKIVGEELGGGAVKQHTFGENYAALAKGFSIASLGVFANGDELEKAGSSEEFAEKLKAKLIDFVEDVFVVDYIV